MVVDQQGARSAADLGIDNRRTAGEDWLGRGADPLQALLHQRGHVRHALARGGDAGLRDQRFQIVNEALTLFGKEGFKRRHGAHSLKRLG